MEVKVLQVGPIGTNCYILEDEKARAAAIIDPGDEAGRILQVIEDDGVDVKYILLTHGHSDHTTAVPQLHKALPQAEIYIHRADANGAGSQLFPRAGQIPDLKFYDEGDTLALGDMTIQVLHTPGHSRGSVTLKVGDVLFCGDTLFAGSCGRTDFPGGSMKQMMASLARLAALPGDYRVLPGHMEPSTLDRERRFNPYMQMALREQG